MTRIDERVNEMCPCGHTGGRHIDLGDGFCTEIGCSCAKFGTHPVAVDDVARALAAINKADRVVDAAEQELLERKRELAVLLGRNPEGKDFDFEAEHEAREILVARAIREADSDDARERLR